MSRIIKLLGVTLSFINSLYLPLSSIPIQEINNLPIQETNSFLIAKINLCADSSPFLLNLIKNDINKDIVKNLSGLLPQADIISKKVLEWNDIWIERILYSRTIPENLKKSLIINLINIVQNGDNAGSGFLIWYKDVIDCLLP
tara:strand:+ start:63 stop:491 length:429 start_codon:yes stop_codon:yes gene_type:complete